MNTTINGSADIFCVGFRYARCAIQAESNQFDRHGGNKAFPKYVPVRRLSLMTIHDQVRN